MKDDRGERERHKPFPPSLRSKEKQNLPAPPSKETPRSQVCRKIFLFLHSKMSGLTSAQCFDNVGPKAGVFIELSGTIKPEHVLARMAPVPHTLSPTLPRSRAPSTAAPYQRLAQCCLTQSFVELLGPLFNLLLRLFPVGLSSKFVHPLFPIYLPACSVSSNVPSIDKNTPGTLVAPRFNLWFFRKFDLGCRTLSPSPFSPSFLISIFLPVRPSPPLYSPSHPSFQSQALASCLSWPPRYFVSLAHDPSNYISHHMPFTLRPNPPPLLINVFFFLFPLTLPWSKENGPQTMGHPPVYQFCSILTQAGNSWYVSEGLCYHTCCFSPTVHRHDPQPLIGGGMLCSLRYLPVSQTHMEVTKRLRHHQTEVMLRALGVWGWGILWANNLRQANQKGMNL